MVDGLVRRMVRRRFWMACVFVFVDLVVFEISALFRWLGRLFFDAVLPLGALRRLKTLATPCALKPLP